MHHGPEFTAILILCFTLIVGAGLRLLCRRLGIPYTIGVLLVGLGCGAAASAWPTTLGPFSLLKAGGQIGHELIIFVFLPALVFESAFSIKVHAFRKDARPILILAGPALLFCAALMGLFVKWLTSYSWQWDLLTCLVFGALISATDPVAVVALLKELGAPKRLGLLIEGESLFNDGTSIVVFGVLLELMLKSQSFHLGHTLGHFLLVTVGGFLLGLLIAIICSVWIGRMFNDPTLEITITLIMAYTTMLVVEGMFHLSGVMAVVAAGLWLSGPGRTAISPEVEHFLHRFWEMLSYLANTLIFFLVGLVVAAQGHRLGLLELGLIVVCYLAVMAIRALTMWLFRPVLGSATNPVSKTESAVMCWGGLRGAVSLALALIVSQRETLPLELREQILLLTAGVVFLTILINGSTLGRLLHWLKLDRPPAGTRLAAHTCHLDVLNQVRQQVRQVSLQRDLRTVAWSEVDAELENQIAVLSGLVEDVREEVAEEERVRGFWRRYMGVERGAVWRAYSQGCLSSRTAQILDQEVDTRLDMLEAGLDLSGMPSQPLAQVSVLRRLSRGRFKWLRFEAIALRHDLARGQTLAAEAVLKALEGGELDEDARDTIQESYLALQRRGRETLEDLRSNLPEITRAIETRLARRVLLNLERRAVEGVVSTGALDPGAAEEAIAEVEQRMKRLKRNREELELPETADLVQDTELFRDLSPEEFEKLAVITKERVLSLGETLFEENDEGASLFVIARGAVLVYQSDTLLDILGGGDIFGELSLLTGHNRTCSIKAATTVTLGEITRSDFEELLELCPGLKDKTWQTMARRLFEDLLRADPQYQHLGHQERSRWFHNGTHLPLKKGDSVEADREHLFLATGDLETEQGERLVAPCLVPNPGQLRALSACWAVMLPPAFGGC